MDQLRQVLETIRKHLGGLGASQKLLLGSLAVILVMTLGFIALYAGTPRMVELLPGIAPESQRSAANFLAAANIKHEIGADGKLKVPAEREVQARAMLAENGKLPGDKSIMFDTLIEKQSWINSRQQNEQLYIIALQNQLANDIANFKGVRSATVILDIPEASGIGRVVRQPTASATVVSRDGLPLAQATVDAIAGYIAGSRAGLEIDRVRVIDSAAGKQRRATTETDLIPTTYLEHATRVETLTRDKIAEMLGYIPGVIVSVTAQVDVTKVNSVTTEQLPKGQGTLNELKRTTEKEEKSVQVSPGGGGAGGGSGAGGEAGLQANVGADLNRGGRTAGGSNTSTTTSDSEFEIIPGTKQSTVVDPRGMATMVAVSVNVPRGFVSALVNSAAGSAGSAGGGAATPPTDQQIDDQFDKAIRPKIEASIRPHVRTMMASANRAMSDQELDRLVQQSVSVALMPVDLPASAQPAKAGLLGGVGGGFALGGGIIDKVVLGGMAVLALGMMLMLVKKAGKKQDVPTAEELIGLPPQLDGGSDLIGEAHEGDAPLEGIEVDEDQVQSQKILEQVGDLVNENPGSAAKLLQRWMQAEE